MASPATGRLISRYAKMMDIMTYDDLLRRLDNVIASLRRRIVGRRASS
jgi:hypothetical protein